MNGGDLDENALFRFLHVAPGTVARITPEA